MCRAVTFIIGSKNRIIKKGTFINRKNRSIVYKNQVARCTVRKKTCVRREGNVFIIKRKNAQTVYNGKGICI